MLHELVLVGVMKYALLAGKVLNKGEPRVPMDSRSPASTYSLHIHIVVLVLGLEPFVEVGRGPLSKSQIESRITDLINSWKVQPTCQTTEVSRKIFLIYQQLTLVIDGF